MVKTFTFVSDPSVAGGIVYARDLSYKTVKEDWNVYELEDGAVLKVKVAAIKISRGEHPETGEIVPTKDGEPLYNIRYQVIVGAEVPEGLLAKKTK